MLCAAWASRSPVAAAVRHGHRATPACPCPAHWGVGCAVINVLRPCGVRCRCACADAHMRMRMRMCDVNARTAGPVLGSDWQYLESDFGPGFGPKSSGSRIRFLADFNQVKRLSLALMLPSGGQRWMLRCLAWTGYLRSRGFFSQLFLLVFASPQASGCTRSGLRSTRLRSLSVAG